MRSQVAHASPPPSGLVRDTSPSPSAAAAARLPFKI
jgi:hypothetical protein